MRFFAIFAAIATTAVMAAAVPEPGKLVFMAPWRFVQTNKV